MTKKRKTTARKIIRKAPNRRLKSQRFDVSFRSARDPAHDHPGKRARNGWPQ